MKNLKGFTGRLKSGIRQCWLRDVWRMQPSGPLSWRFFVPGQSPAVRLHRRLWWKSRYKLPRLIWLSLELFRWIYWQVWAVSRQVQSAVLIYGPEIEVRHGIALAEQCRKISYWAKSWSICPAYAYYLGLFRSETNALNKILSTEVQHFHGLMNEQRSVSQEDYRLLYDKCQLAERMAEVGLPVVPLIGESADGSLDLKRIVAAHGPVFCKLRAGSRGESAFMATSGVTGLIGQTLAGKKLGSEAAVLAAWKTLVDKGPVLIQPYLRNHPLLQALSKDGDSLTLRVITRATASGFMVWTGFLYIPAPVESLEREYWVLKIDADTGLAFDAFGHWLGSESEITYSAPLLVLVGQALPFWPEIVNYSVQAHAEIPRLWSIAWDWIITPDGPILLEGNAGWDLSPLQDLGVDFVKIGVAASGNIYAERH